MRQVPGLFLALLSTVGLGHDVNQNLYEPVEGWPRGLPQASLEISAVAVDHTAPGKEVFISQRGKNLLSTTAGPVLVFNGEGDLLRSFGNDTVMYQNGTWGAHGLDMDFPPPPSTPRLWIYDMFAGSVLVHSSRTGRLLMRGGTGEQGSDVLPYLQYGCVADGDFDNTRGIAYVADGDGGPNDRVVALNARKHINDPDAVLWIAGNGASSPADPHFSSPHSLCFHPRTRSLFVADREMNRTQILSAESGKVLGEWTCPSLGHAGKAWGVRSSFPRDDLIFLAVADSPETGRDQFVHVLDGSQVTSEDPGPCRVLQTIQIPAKLCVTPHEVGVDLENGDMYLACVTADPKQGSPKGDRKSVV